MYGTLPSDPHVILKKKQDDEGGDDETWQSRLRWCTGPGDCLFKRFVLALKSFSASQRGARIVFDVDYSEERLGQVSRTRELPALE